MCYHHEPLPEPSMCFHHHYHYHDITILLHHHTCYHHLHQCTVINIIILANCAHIYFTFHNIQVSINKYQRSVINKIDLQFLILTQDFIIQMSCFKNNLTSVFLSKFHINLCGKDILLNSPYLFFFSKLNEMPKFISTKKMVTKVLICIAQFNTRSWHLGAF